MAKIEGFERVQQMLERRKQQCKDATVFVGFTQNYAIFVHENLHSKHPVGQAKYLEQPAREYKQEIIGIIKAAFSKGMDLGNALVLGGLKLQREAQLLCPIDTGALRASAFTRKEEN